MIVMGSTLGVRAAALNSVDQKIILKKRLEAEAVQLIGRPRKQKSEDKQLAVIIKDLVKADVDISDVGTIIACLKGDVKSLKELKDECSSIDEFLELASRKANIALVTAAIEAAIGYDYIETEQLIKKEPHIVNGRLEIREVPGNLKIKKKHAKKNDQLLKFILTNRLPEYFSDVKKVEINKRSIEIKANTEAEIRGFAGRLLDAFKDEKIIEAEIVDTDS